MGEQTKALLPYLRRGGAHKLVTGPPGGMLWPESVIGPSPVPANSPESRHAVQRMFLAHQPWLLERLSVRLDSRVDAEDLASETWTQVLGHPQPHVIRQPRAFLTTVAKRLLFHFWRRRDLERAWLNALAQMPETVDVSEEDRVLLREALERIDAALDGMPLPARTAFLQSQLDGLTYSQIAGRMGVSVMTVRRHVAEGVRRCYLATASDD